MPDFIGSRFGAVRRELVPLLFSFSVGCLFPFFGYLLGVAFTGVFYFSVVVLLGASDDWDMEPSSNLTLFYFFEEVL